jgi:hypothetical protein
MAIQFNVMQPTSWLLLCCVTSSHLSCASVTNVTCMLHITTVLLSCCRQQRCLRYVGMWWLAWHCRTGPMLAQTLVKPAARTVVPTE